MQKLVRLSAVTKADRQQTIERAKEAINANGGWIENFTLFSNIAVCLNFQLPGQHAAALGAALSAMELHWDAQSEGALAALSAAPHESLGDLISSLQITFLHEEPDLRIPVLPIPG
jgi:hypothetical protein